MEGLCHRLLLECTGDTDQQTATATHYFSVVYLVGIQARLR